MTHQRGPAYLDKGIEKADVRGCCEQSRLTIVSRTTACVWCATTMVQFWSLEQYSSIRIPEDPRMLPQLRAQAPKHLIAKIGLEQHKTPPSKEQRNWEPQLFKTNRTSENWSLSTAFLHCTFLLGAYHGTCNANLSFDWWNGPDLVVPLRAGSRQHFHTDYGLGSSFTCSFQTFPTFVDRAIDYQFFVELEVWRRACVRAGPVVRNKYNTKMSITHSIISIDVIGTKNHMHK